jgi:hypothetical protein
MALGRGLCLLKTAVMANRAALHDGPRRHIANPITNKGPEADTGRNGVVAYPRIGVVPAITAFWAGLVGRPLQRVVAHIFVTPDFCPGSFAVPYGVGADMIERPGLNQGISPIRQQTGNQPIFNYLFLGYDTRLAEDVRGPCPGRFLSVTAATTADIRLE